MVARGNQQVVHWIKPGGRTTVFAAGAWYTLINVVGPPGTGTLAGSSTAAGVVPTDATVGFPAIESFNGDAGFIHKIEVTGLVATSNMCRHSLNDLLFKAGAYAFNDAVTLAAQPSFSSRIPGGTDYKSLEIWFECVTAFTGNPTIVVTYTDDQGNAGHSTTLNLTAPVANSCFQFPLATGDNGVSLIESVTATVASVGTFNILVLRPLWKHGILTGATIDPSAFFDLDQVSAPSLFDDSALYPLYSTSSTLNTTNPEMLAHIAHGTPAAGGDFTVDVGMDPARSGSASVSGSSYSRVVNRT